eukprot:767876-Hanusia_phi.AAC.6
MVDLRDLVVVRYYRLQALDLAQVRAELGQGVVTEVQEGEGPDEEYGIGDLVELVVVDHELPQRRQGDAGAELRRDGGDGVPAEVERVESLEVADHGVKGREQVLLQPQLLQQDASLQHAGERDKLVPARRQDPQARVMSHTVGDELELVPADPEDLETSQAAKVIRKGCEASQLAQLGGQQSQSIVGQAQAEEVPEGRDFRRDGGDEVVGQVHAFNIFVHPSAQDLSQSLPVVVFVFVAFALHLVCTLGRIIHHVLVPVKLLRLAPAVFLLPFRPLAVGLVCIVVAPLGLGAMLSPHLDVVPPGPRRLARALVPSFLPLHRIAERSCDRSRLAAAPENFDRASRWTNMKARLSPAGGIPADCSAHGTLLRSSDSKSPAENADKPLPRT